MQKAMIIINPTSGKAQGVHYGQLLQQKLVATYVVDVRETTCQGDATRFAREACVERYDVIVLVGGDGTVHEGIAGIAEQVYRPTVAIIPLGTVNDFARALHIPLKPEEAVMLIGQQTKMVDIGKVNDHYFMNVVAIGELPQAVGDVSIEQKTKLGALAYLIEGTKVAMANETFHLKLQSEAGDVEGETLLCFIALTDSVAGFRSISQEALVDDGYLHGYIIKAGSIFDTARLVTTIFSGDFSEDASVKYIAAKQMHMQATVPLKLNVDGDILGTLPATFHVLPRHVEVFVRKSPLNKQL